MGELSIFEGSNIPSYLKGHNDELTIALAGRAGGATRRRISIEGGVFREYINGKEVNVSEDRFLDILIVNAAKAVSRIYHEGAYVKGQASAPTCWSQDGERPDASVKNKQSNLCVKCPRNVKGSGNNESRACRYQQRLAVLLVGVIEREEVYQLALPATSIFGDAENGKMPLQAYAEYLSKRPDGGVPIWGVITTMKFDAKSTAPKLIFRPKRSITEDEYNIVKRLTDSKEVIEAVTLTVAQTDGIQPVASKPATATPKPTPTVDEDEDDAFDIPAPAPKKAEPKPAPIEDEEDDIAPPKKAESKKAAPVASEPKLEDLLGDDWDD